MAMFLEKVSKNPIGYAPVFAASGLLLFSFLYLAIIRIVWAIIGCSMFCCRDCADMCRCPCRVVLGFLTFIFMCTCLSEALYPEKLQAKMVGTAVGSVLGGVSSLGSQAGAAITSNISAGFAGLGNLLGGLGSLGRSRRRLFDIGSIVSTGLSTVGAALGLKTPAIEFAELARDLGLTTLVLYFILPCVFNTAFLISIMTCKDSLVEMLQKPERASIRVGVNNVPFLLTFAGMCNKEAADQIRLGGPE